jgi:hypothetical protein
VELPHTTTRLPGKNSQAFPLSWYTELSLVTKNSASDIQISLGNTFEVCPLFCHRKDCSSQKIYFFKNTTNNHMVCLLQLCGLVSSISFPSFATMLSISQCDCVIAYRCTLMGSPCILTVASGGPRDSLLRSKHFIVQLVQCNGLEAVFLFWPILALLQQKRNLVQSLQRAFSLKKCVKGAIF